jgi:hypothetical protein
VRRMGCTGMTERRRRRCRGAVLVHAGHPLVLLETIPTDSTTQQRPRRRRATLRRSGCRGRAAAALHDEAGSSVLRVIAGPDGHPLGRVHPMSRPSPPGAHRAGSLRGTRRVRHGAWRTGVPPGQLPSGSGAMRRATAAAVRSDPVPVGWKGNGSVRPCRSGPVDAAAGSGVHSGAEVRSRDAEAVLLRARDEDRVELVVAGRRAGRPRPSSGRPLPRGPGGPHRPGPQWPAARRTRS